jgi:hypothetical protein
MGDEVTFRAGWWAPLFDEPRTVLTGGFTSRDVDVCDYLRRREPLGEQWSFGNVLFKNEGDADSDTHPDPREYTVLPGGEGDHTEPRGVEISTTFTATWRVEGGIGVVDVRDIDAEHLTMDLAIELADGAGRLDGSTIQLTRCDWFVPEP